MERFNRFLRQPCLPLGEDGKKVTMCQAHLELSRRAATEGAVLLKNEKAALPLKKGEKLALFGIGCVDYYKGGLGSGDVYTQQLKNNLDGLEEKEAEGKVSIYKPLAEFYRCFYAQEKLQLEPSRRAEFQEMEKLPYDCPQRSREETRLQLKYRVGEPELSEELFQGAAKFAQTAIVSISRISGENWDRKPDKGDYYLSDAEQALINRVTAAFEKVIVVLNVGGMVDTVCFSENERIGALLLAWQGGTLGGLATADLLCGDANPSGKLTDTFAKSYEAYPSSAGYNANDDYVEYNEDIYVGYRYFETIPGAKKQVNYPFGYGLSYTDFALSGMHAFCDGENITVTATVKNIGAVAGKETVQVYYSAPQGKLGKPSKALAAFQKTKLLCPGEAQTIVVAFPISQMASFDDLGKLAKSAFVLEQGSYCFYVGTSVAAVTELDYQYVVEANRVTEQLSSRCAPIALQERMLADGSMEQLPVGDKVEQNIPARKPLTAKAPEQATHLNQVGITLTPEEFVAQLTDEELADLLGGKDNVGVSNTCTLGGNDRLRIPRFATADGPAGLRLGEECGIPTTAWPIGTMLACTWNPELVSEVGAAGAKEVKENNLAIWLTPALNIHRNPLCGRNFEYYSEDPVVSGKIAAAMVRGIQSQKIGTSVKHLAANNKELHRMASDSRVSERALREVYLKGFEICVKEAKPWTVMTSYNILNGIHTSESYDLTEGILRQEWGFDGMVTTDWGVKNDPVLEVRVGSDMKMPFGYPQELMEALKEGKLTRADMEQCALRIVKTLMKFD